jgi:predicted nucleotidyltransferase
VIAPDLDTARWFIEQHGARTPLVVAVTGAHAYGFPSEDSDLDLKAIHVAPTAAILSLAPPPDSMDVLTELDGTEIDYTSHELGFALRLLIRGNGNMLERILSPFQVYRSEGREWLQGLTRGVVCKRFHRHYRGFFGRIQQDCRKAPVKTAKLYLYAYRSALTGIHLLRTGQCILDVEVLAREHRYEVVPELVARKRGGAEHEPADDVARYESDWARLEMDLETALANTTLPDTAPNVDALSAFLIEERRRQF